MSSKGKILCKFSLHRWILTIIILCTSVWWAPAKALAQEAALAALHMTAHSTLWSRLCGHLDGQDPTTLHIW
jgi:hypothetical protein